MTPEQTFEQLLGLGQSWKVVSTDFEAKRNTFVICVTETEALWPEESARCGQTVTCYDHVEPMQWRHLNVFNKECVIVSALPRGLAQPGRGNLPGDAALGGAQQAFQQGV